MKKKSFLEEFKEFISRGSVIDMAVGVIIGGAFTTIVNSLVNDLIMPVVGYLIGGIDFQHLKFALPALAGKEPVYIAYGAFLQNIINFLIIAFVVFCMVKFINSFRRKADAPAAPVAPSEEVVLLTEIRDALKNK